MGEFGPKDQIREKIFYLGGNDAPSLGCRSGVDKMLERWEVERAEEWRKRAKATARRARWRGEDGALRDAVNAKLAARHRAADAVTKPIKLSIRQGELF